VRDSGIGIPAAAQEKLFKPFSQVDATAARKYEGTGLGLAICARLVELMGGAIAVSSEAGKGSTFTFTLATRAAVASERDVRPDHFAVHGKRALLVDDNETILRILSSVLRRWGLTCDLALSPQLALTRLREDTAYDLAVIDYHMPEMNGVELAREIRGIAGREKLPLTLFTSVETAASAAADVDQLFAAKLMKPLRQSQLFETLNGLLAGKVVTVRTAPQRLVSAGERAARARVKILVAEDNPVNMRLVHVMLDKLGYRADGVSSGGEALDAVKRRAYDVVLMDVQMPNMDGLEATRRIRAQLAAHRQPYVIAVTANVLYEDRQEYVRAGMNSFLGKPFTMNELQAVLNEAQRAHGAGVPREAPPAEAAADEPGSVELLDRQRFEEVKSLTREAGPDVLSGMVQNLQRDLEAFDAALAARLAQQDATGVARAAHSLKGSSHSLGAQALGNLFAELERLAKSGQLEAVAYHYQRGKPICADTLGALTQADVTA